MELATVEPLCVSEIGTYQRDDASPMTRRDGSPVRYVAFDGLVTDRGARRFTVAPTLTGELPAIGQFVNATFAVSIKTDAKAGANGPYVVHTLQLHLASWSKS